MPTKTLSLLATGLLLGFNCRALSFDEWVDKTEHIRTESARLTAENCKPTLERLTALVDNWHKDAVFHEIFRPNGP